MQKSEGVVIHLPDELNDVCFISPVVSDVEKLKQLPALEPFHNDVIRFLDTLSKDLNRNPRIREFPDVATFAFFCRKANMIKLKEQYLIDKNLRLGRGIVFHITPSNVPVNFAYSLLCGILAGNVNIVRTPSRAFEQINIICNAIAGITGHADFKEISDRIVFVRYDKQSSATDFFSSFCDVRIIWGGDEAINQIRKSPIPPRSFDITFADRFSMCAINADSYIEEENPLQVAKGFYNDTYLFDQNACSSPHLVVWIGKKENIRDSRKIFWESLHEIVKQKQYELQPLIAVDKLTTLYSQAILSDGIKKVGTSDNRIWHIELERLPENIDKFHSSGGYFSEYQAASLSEISRIINRKYQTLAYYGFDKSELHAFMQHNRPLGIDRIVPIGHTSDFSLNWDGYDLIRTLSRICKIDAR